MNGIEQFMNIYELDKELYPWRGMPIYIDVDGTLINHWDSPKVHVLNFVKFAHSLGCELYLWSQGGKDYAKEHAERLGIAHMFVAFMTKPALLVDDLEVDITPWLEQGAIIGSTGCIHPMQLVGINIPEPVKKKV